VTIETEEEVVHAIFSLREVLINGQRMYKEERRHPWRRR